MHSLQTRVSMHVQMFCASGLPSMNKILRDHAHVMRPTCRHLLHDGAQLDAQHHRFFGGRHVEGHP